MWKQCSSYAVRKHCGAPRGQGWGRGNPCGQPLADSGDWHHPQTSCPAFSPHFPDLVAESGKDKAHYFVQKRKKMYICKLSTDWTTNCNKL